MAAEGAPSDLIRIKQRLANVLTKLYEATSAAHKGDGVLSFDEFARDALNKATKQAGIANLAGVVNESKFEAAAAKKFKKSALSFDPNAYVVYFEDGTPIELDSAQKKRNAQGLEKNWREDYEGYITNKLNEWNLTRKDSGQKTTTVDETQLLALVKDASFLPKDQNLDADWAQTVRVAAQLANIKLPDMEYYSGCGEMLLQQLVYPPIAALFLSFRPKYYCAGQMIMGHETVQRMGVDGHAACVAKCRPDGAIRLTTHFHTIAMMEIQPDKSNELWEMDPFVCILMTTLALLAIDKIQQLYDDNPNETTEISIPFILGEHDSAKLFVTRFFTCEDDGKRRPAVQLLRSIYLGSCHDGNDDVLAKKADFMAVTAIVLADIGNDDCTTPSKKRPACAANDWQDKKQKLAQESHDDKPSAAEDNAAKAASAVGKVLDVVYPWQRALSYNMDADEAESRQAEFDYYQQVSPFFFTGRLLADDDTGVFCKVWRNGDDGADPSNINNEIALFRDANKHQVPTPTVLNDGFVDLPLDDTIGGANGQRYHVLVTTRHRQDQVALQDFATFTSMLVRAVLKLHSIGILHCDIKGRNILWDAQAKVLRLIDFGHAQRESNARHCLTTQGCMAPEVVNGGPHNRRSDAFSVGKALRAAFLQAFDDNAAASAVVADDEDEASLESGGDAVGVDRLITVAGDNAIINSVVMPLLTESADKRLRLEDAGRFLASYESAVNVEP